MDIRYFFIILFLTFCFPAIPVPLFPAAPCPECSKFGVLGIVVVTSNSKAHRCSVVTKDGNENFFLNILQ